MRKGHENTENIFKNVYKVKSVFGALSGMDGIDLWVKTCKGASGAPSKFIARTRTKFGRFLG